MGVAMSRSDKVDVKADSAASEPVDTLTKLLAKLFVRHRPASVVGTVVFYAAVILAFGNALEVSANYFVLLPVLVAAMCFGTMGGFVAGALGLPANLLLFALLGHPEYSPASKLIAELSGLFLGLCCGRLADYFRELENEIKKRAGTEEALRAALAEKKLLLRELHHRVKNNLSVIKSLVQLQRNRSSDPDFLEAADELVGRILAISLVHDMLDVDRSLAMVELAKFIEALVNSLEESLGLDGERVGLDLDAEGCAIQIEAATSLGLIVNEVLTNALKYATRREALGQGPERPGSPAREAKPGIQLSLKLENLPAGAQYRLVIIDDGPGPKRDFEATDGLGLKLVRALARNLGGRVKLEAIVAVPWGARGAERGAEAVGAKFELVFPATFMELI
jgi:two-component sensor histidine kinase